VIVEDPMVPWIDNRFEFWKEVSARIIILEASQNICARNLQGEVKSQKEYFRKDELRKRIIDFRT
jgi:hypothetical protein